MIRRVQIKSDLSSLKELEEDLFTVFDISMPAYVANVAYVAGVDMNFR